MAEYVVRTAQDPQACADSVDLGICTENLPHSGFAHHALGRLADALRVQVRLIQIRLGLPIAKAGVDVGDRPSIVAAVEGLEGIANPIRHAADTRVRVGGLYTWIG